MTASAMPTGTLTKTCPDCEHIHTFPQIEMNENRCVACGYDFKKKLPHINRLNMTNPTPLPSSEVTYAELHKLINDFSERMDCRIENIDKRCTNMCIDNAKTIEHLRSQRRPEELNIIMERLERLEHLHKRILALEDFVGQNYKRDTSNIEVWMKKIEGKLTAQKYANYVGTHIKNIIDTRNKIPHVCPVCQGTQKRYFNSLDYLGASILPPETELDHEGRKYQQCKPCEGKGIVWG